MDPENLHQGIRKMRALERLITYGKYYIVSLKAVYLSKNSRY